MTNINELHDRNDLGGRFTDDRELLPWSEGHLVAQPLTDAPYVWVKDGSFKVRKIYTLIPGEEEEEEKGDGDAEYCYSCLTDPVTKGE